MKQWTFLALLFWLTLSANAQNITAAEYFFDTDPGAGNGQPITIGTPAPIITFSTAVPTAALTSGFHSLAIRTKDAAGKWGPFEWRTIYVSLPAVNTAPITAAEFFFDNDPGAGNGTSLGISTPGDVVNFSAVIPAASLQPGFHHLIIRTRNAAGQWGLFESRGFYVHSQPVAAQPIVAAEYYIDNDPGVGNGTAISIGNSTNAVTFTALIPTTSLSAGFHNLSIRAKNNDGTWGIIESRGFYIHPHSSNMGPVAAAEYFLDADPGAGNGSPLVITTPATTVSQNMLINIPAGTPNGQHQLAIRVKDANGVWGLFELREITVSGFPLPLNWVSFTAKRINGQARLQWKTANEVNTAHFDVERSRNGIDFVRIGEVPAKHGVENSYDFDDAAPIVGANYYRLKQIDTDGAAKYSVIATVYFGEEAENTLRLYPQPAGSQLYIDFKGRGPDVLVQVYNAAGQMVINQRKGNGAPLFLATEKLTAGTYWLVVSDGVMLQKGKFVKK
jgi:hypothetical protein